MRMNGGDPTVRAVHDTSGHGPGQARLPFDPGPPSLLNLARQARVVAPYFAFQNSVAGSQRGAAIKNAADPRADMATQQNDGALIRARFSAQHKPFEDQANGGRLSIS